MWHTLTWYVVVNHILCCLYKFDYSSFLLLTLFVWHTQRWFMCLVAKRNIQHVKSIRNKQKQNCFQKQHRINISGVWQSFLEIKGYLRNKLNDASVQIKQNSISNPEGEKISFTLKTDSRQVPKPLAHIWFDYFDCSFTLHLI